MGVLPRVGLPLSRMANPWAVRRNPVGIKQNAAAPQIKNLWVMHRCWQGHFAISLAARANSSDGAGSGRFPLPLMACGPVVSGNRITTGFWNAGSRGRFWFARSLRGFGWVFHGNASITFSLRRCSQLLRPDILPWLPRKALPPPAWSVG
jgi:hypothetical protein